MTSYCWRAHFFCLPLVFLNRGKKSIQQHYVTYQIKSFVFDFATVVIVAAISALLSLLLRSFQLLSLTLRIHFVKKKMVMLNSTRLTRSQMKRLCIVAILFSLYGWLWLFISRVSRYILSIYNRWHISLAHKSIPIVYAYEKWQHRRHTLAKCSLHSSSESEKYVWTYEFVRSSETHATYEKYLYLSKALLFPHRNWLCFTQHESVVGAFTFVLCASIRVHGEMKKNSTLPSKSKNDFNEFHILFWFSARFNWNIRAKYDMLCFVPNESYASLKWICFQLQESVENLFKSQKQPQQTKLNFAAMIASRSRENSVFFWQK